MVLGQMLLDPAKRRQLEDAAYNRHTSNDAHLPMWFLDDERKYNHREGYGVDMEEEMLGRAEEKLKDINARSIGKVAEAKGRKQRRQQRALLKLKKKANSVIAKEDLSEREKAREVEKLYKKKLGKEKKEKKLVVGRKFSASGSGKSGHGIKHVDARSRSDKRGKERAEKMKKKGTGKNYKGKNGSGGKSRSGPAKSIVKTKKSKSHTTRR